MADKPHFFELVMNSYSEGKLNQEVVLVREYATTPGELCLKQMSFTKSAAPAILDAVVKACDELSMPYQEQGMEEAMAAFSSPKKPGRSKK